MTMASMEETLKQRIAKAEQEAATSPEVMAAITAVAGSEAVQRILAEGPTDEKLSRIWGRATERGWRDDQDLFLAGTSLFHVYKQRLAAAMEALRAKMAEEKRANSQSTGD